MRNEVIVLAMHGSLPRDLPERELAEFMALHGRVEHGHGEALPRELLSRAAELERRVKEWPRTVENDPFWAASMALGQELEAATGQPVFVGFNEFCSPDLDTVFDRAAAASPSRVVVVTPMLTKGGGHAEVDIPAAIARAQAAHPAVAFFYAWPFETTTVARFLADHLLECAPGARA